METAPDGYGREAKALLSQYFKKEDLYKGGGAGSGLPWATQRQGILNLGKRRDDEERRPKKGEDQKKDEDSESEKVRKVSRLEKQLKELKASLKDARDKKSPVDKKRKKERSPAGSHKDGRKKGAHPFDKGGLDPEKDLVSDVDWDPDDAERESGSETGSERSSSPERKAAKEKTQKERTKRRSKRNEKKDKKKSRKSDKKRKGRKRLDRDKGPFGVGETRRLPREESGSESEGESSSSDRSSQSFRKAPSGLTLHLRLQRYAQRHPGRLATRLLQRMERATRFEGVSIPTGTKGSKVVPWALSYYLAILVPSLKERWNQRTQREMRIWSEVLDMLAMGRGSTAADLIAQRLKALEQSVVDGNTWKKAKFLELVAEESGMADKGEEQMMVKEAELEDRFRGRTPWSSQRWDESPAPKGKEGKGSGKKGKGKGKAKTPAQEAAEKKT